MGLTDKLLEGLSVVMIGRNEENILKRALSPLKEIADEIVFVDTGSNDRTIEIANSFQCRVIERHWDDDFSAPKNMGIEHANHKWILNIDCDEELIIRENTKSILDQGLKSINKPAFIIWLDHLTTDGRIIPQESIRLFRNDPKIRFLNPIHENICDSLYKHWPSYKPVVLDIHFKHHGFKSGNNEEKYKRNITIMRKWVKNEPDNLYGLYKLGMNLYSNRDIQEGLHFLDKAFSLLNRSNDKWSYPFASKLITSYYKALLDNNMQGKAETVNEIVTTWKQKLERN